MKILNVIFVLFPNIDSVKNTSVNFTDNNFNVSEENFGVTIDKIPSDVKCSTKYKLPPAIMSLLETRNPRIVGGIYVDLNTWGWYARLDIYDPSVDEYFLCGATIIDKRFLLTVTHCIIEIETLKKLDPSNVHVYINDYTAYQKDEFEQEILVKKIYRHPNYDPKRNGNDITLLGGISN